MIVSGGVILTVTVVLSWFDSGFSIGRVHWLGVKGSDLRFQMAVLNP